MKSRYRRQPKKASKNRLTTYQLPATCNRTWVSRGQSNNPFYVVVCRGIPRIPMTPRWHNIGLATIRWRGYAIAALGPLLAAAERWYLGVPIYITFLPILFVASLLGGTRAGVVATVLSLVAGNLAFMEPYGKLEIVTMHQALGMGLFGVIGIGPALSARGFRTFLH
jgi:hypothetical protein